MKKRFICLWTAILFMAAILCGCGSTSDYQSITEKNILKNPKSSVAGTWVNPHSKLSITCNEDGTYTSTNAENQNGKYTYLSENKYFTIADTFKDETLEYVTFTDEKNKEVLMGVILSDLIIAFDLESRAEEYYFRNGRAPAEPKDVIGKWLDSTGSDYTMKLQENGTFFSNDEEGSYVMRTDGDTTYLTTTVGNSETEYMVLRYNDYLFTYQKDKGTMFLYRKQ